MLLTFGHNLEPRKCSKHLQQRKMIDFQGKISKFLSEVEFFVIWFRNSFGSFSQLRKSYVLRFRTISSFETLFRILVSILGNLTWNSRFQSHLVLSLIRSEVSEPLNIDEKDENRFYDQSSEIYLTMSGYSNAFRNCFQNFHTINILGGDRILTFCHDYSVGNRTNHHF